MFDLTKTLPGTVEQEFKNTEGMNCFDVWELQNDDNEDRDLVYIQIRSENPITDEDRMTARHVFTEYLS